MLALNIVDALEESVEPFGAAIHLEGVEEAPVGKADRDAVLAAADINANANVGTGGSVHGVACVGQTYRFVRRSRLLSEPHQKADRHHPG